MKKRTSFFILAVIFMFLLITLSIKPDFYKSIVEKGSNQISERLSPTAYPKLYPNTVLTDMWDTYKDDFIQDDGRTIDKGANLITTSEGQSYTMLRAVWVDDRETFDNAWRWTNINLKKRPDDKLFAWKWGQRSDGSWGILEEEDGMNTASDADQDIALALILAYYRWNDEYYLTQAKNTLTDIWRTEVVTINGKPYLTAGNWAEGEEAITVNPSYYSFAAYPIFAQIDPVNDWNAVKDTSYSVLFNFSDRLPPDWAEISKSDLSVEPASLNDKPISFAHDASRVVWRVGLDWQQHADPRAHQYLQQLKVPENQWTNTSIINESYELDGQPLSSQESLSMYSTLLPYFQYTDKNSMAEQIIKKKIISKFNPDTGSFKEPVGYYDANWAWFGLAAFNQYIFFPEIGGPEE